ncbi:hypothetical protein MKW92_005376 [Papaver armeniacum]|nr:hypothetical protein MKW92_005376 [Papaver armeniacum]
MEEEYQCLVSNVPAGTTKAVLTQTFQKYGNIFEVQIRPAEQCTIGLVTFHKKEDMDAAISGTNIIGQTRLRVSDASLQRRRILSGGDDEQGGSSDQTAQN